MSVFGDDALAVDELGSVQVFEPKRLPQMQSEVIGSTPPSWCRRNCRPRDRPCSFFFTQIQRPRICFSGNLAKLHLRQIETGKEWEITLPAPLGGTAALSANALVLPLANGSLLRVSLAGDIKASLLNWRSELADASARGHVVSLGGDEYLVTDGSKGVRLVHWADGQPEQVKDQLLLGSRIAEPPVLVPGEAGKPPAVVVADAENGIMLVQTKPLQLQRQWPALGVITAGPFVRAGGIGCIVDHQQFLDLAGAGQDGTGVGSTRPRPPLSASRSSWANTYWLLICQAASHCLTCKPALPRAKG